VINTAATRLHLREARQALQQALTLRTPPLRHLRAHAKLVDTCLIKVWHDIAIPGNLALAAVGGYGRGELYPKSDIDLLILLPAQPNESQQQQLQTLIGVLWDIGLEVGHSIRTVDECLAECSDITVQTNLLEARLLTGDAALFRELQTHLTAHLDPRAFFLSKWEEQQKRHARFLDADTNLEPNLKESPGGLRDLQTVLWISQACGFGATWQELAEHGLITEKEAQSIAKHESLLRILRIRLHYLAKRREDRLLFDFQAAMAEEMQTKSHGMRRASEVLMQRYYRTKQAILQLNAILLDNLRSRLFPEETADFTPVNARFIARNNRLEARDEHLFEYTPSSVLESFLLLQKIPQLEGFSAPTLRALWRARSLINAEFRRNPAHRALFMEILRQPRGITHVLRLMNRIGLLGRYLPAFGRIVGQMQHDLFHVYTVDEHILMVVRNLRRITVGEFNHEQPLCSQLIRDFARPEVLYIAGLFHDIAKGRGGDHSMLGRADVARFCKQHGLTREDADLAVWLVEHHLTMSSTAQKQDLSDQDVIASFAEKIPNDRYLVALYLLTVADIRGTSPKVWNAWKGKLLDDLFRAARRYLSGGKTADLAGEIRRQAAETLGLYAITPDTYTLLWAQLDNEYFLRHEAHEIAWHTRLLAHRVNTPSPVVKARLSRIGEGIQVVVYCPDQPYLFARICGFFARMSYNIMEAKIHTTQHGYALDSFLVMDAGNSKTVYRDVMNFIEYELSQQLGDSKAPPAPSTGRISRQLKHFPIQPEIDLSQDDKGRFVMHVIAGDRPGLLARIAHTLARHNVEVRNAKVNTLGERAEDTFWLTGTALKQPQEPERLKDELRQQIA
jgi:[protein-PII] uridylyltransferase